MRGKPCFSRALCSTRNLCSTTRTFWAGCPQVALPLMVHSFPPLQSAIPSHIHDRNVSYHISIMCFRTEVGNGRGEDHHTDFSGERSGPSCPVRPVKTPLQSVARLLGRGISLAGAQLGGKPRAPSPQFLQNTLNVNAYVNAEMLARKSRANPSNSSNFELHDERADDPRHEDSF